MNQGWIGSWSPGIGDPTVGGWITVALYAATAWACLRVLQRGRGQLILLGNHERLVWRLILLAMVVLGINKQLDLQSALTEFGRILASEQGWYGNRRQYQEAFIAAVIVMGFTALAAMTVLVWRSPAPTLLACAGAAGLIVFVAVRAASFHHVDAWLGWRWGGLPMNWILEMGSLLLIAGGAVRRGRVAA